MKKVLIFFLFFVLISGSQAQDRLVKTTDDVELFVTVKGKGIPCLYVHGGPGSGSYWAEKFAGDSLEQHFQMIYLDQRGCGRSSGPKDNNYSMSRMVADFEEVRMVLGINQWLVMGHSFGGLLQMGYAKSHPQVIKGMLMINCTLEWEASFEKGFCPKACSLPEMADSKWCKSDSAFFVDRFGALIGELNQMNLMWKLGYASYDNYLKMGETFGEVPDWNWGSEEHIVYTKDYHENFRKYTPGMNMPVLFFYGKSDWIIGPEHYKEIYFPHMILWGSDVGHMPFLENSNDLFKAIKSYRDKYKF
jgi:proline iminopeptidase